MTDLSKVATHEMKGELEARGDWPDDPTLTEFPDYSTDEIMVELEGRETWDDVKDKGSLANAIDQLRWGNVGLCAHYLIRAIPDLHPLGKILGA
jgi:hypothetical protein